MLRKILNGISTVAEDTFLSIDEGDIALAGARVGKPRVDRYRTGSTSQFPDVKSGFVLGPNGYGKFYFLIVDREASVIHGCSLIERQVSRTVERVGRVDGLQMREFGGK